MVSAFRSSHRSFLYFPDRRSRSRQRPGANILPGQIKNNMDFRVCGRADSVLSQIILDNTSAADQIPKDARGRFITGDGTVFQGYLFDEEQL